MPKDLKPLTALAEKGDARAQCELGVRYFYGQGVGKNFKEALKWWRKAAEQGNANAQSRLAHMYRDAKGVKRDYKRAIDWFW